MPPGRRCADLLPGIVIRSEGFKGVADGIENAVLANDLCARQPGHAGLENPGCSFKSFQAAFATLLSCCFPKNAQPS
jgi:hypothetical protein